jgi:hypothetical protein
MALTTNRPFQIFFEICFNINIRKFYDKNKLINTILLFAVLSGNVWADSKAVYDSKTKTLSLEGVLVPFIDEFTGKETDNKGVFDAQLQEKTKFEANVF